MAVPKKQWQENLGKMVLDYFKADQVEKEAKKKKKELKDPIVAIMKEHKITRYVFQGVSALLTVKEKLPDDIPLLKSIIGPFWGVVARQKISYDINREMVDKYIKKGEIDEEEWKNALIYEDALKVSEVKRDDKND